MEIKRLDNSFTVCKVQDYSLVCLEDEYCFIGKTDEENSLVCISEKVPENVADREDGWRAFRIQGVLDFSLIGILSKITSILAEHSIGVFAISTYNTDYIFVKEENFCEALKLITNEGYEIVL
ncbi:MAG: ACT domain-containing protein [Lachnospiraceae bacterium]|nr:ACT domain-containing protein [Lachnospiraceae bacterium]